MGTTIPDTLHCAESWWVNNRKEFQWNIDPENIKCRTSFLCHQKNKTEGLRLISSKCLVYREMIAAEFSRRSAINLAINLPINLEKSCRSHEREMTQGGPVLPSRLNWVLFVWLDWSGPLGIFSRLVSVFNFNWLEPELSCLYVPCP